MQLTRVTDSESPGISRVRGPRFRDSGTDLASAVQSHEIRKKIPEEQPFAVVAWVERVCRVDRLRQCDGEGIERFRRLSDQQAGIFT